MNKTLLLIIIDFLFLNLIALTRWEKAEPVRPQRPPVPTVSANAAATTDQDLVEAMRQSLADEQATRSDIAQKLSAADSSLAANQQSLAALQAEKGRLAASLTDTQSAAAQLNRQVAADQEEAALTKDQLARLQSALDEKTAESERQKKALDDLNTQQAGARKEIEGLTMAVVVDEAEKQHLQQEAAQLQTQVQNERADRLKVQADTAQLAQGVDQLAENSGNLTKEIRDNRPVPVNVLFNDFLANRVQTTFSATRKGLFGPVNRSKTTSTVFTTDGKNVYALLPIEDTTFSLWEGNYDWEDIGIGFDRPQGNHAKGTALEFLTLDPRVVVVPVDSAQAAALGVKVYPLAADPLKFPDAVIISGSGKGYGEVGFKLDPDQPGYVHVDNRLFKRLFGEFSPSRGDLVFSHTGELLGIMVNSDYCAILKDFTPVKTIQTGEDAAAQKTGPILDSLSTMIQGLPQKLQ